MFFPLHDRNPTTRTPIVTYAIVAFNVVAFLWMFRLSPLALEELYYDRGFVPARIAQLVDGRQIEVTLENAPLDPQPNEPQPNEPQPNEPQPNEPQTKELPALPQQILLSLLTCMFLHGGPIHLIGNMWFLWLFGNNVEDRLGHAVFLAFYLVGGLLASACHWVVQPGSTTPVIGASGAVAVMLGAYAVTWPWARVKTLVFLVVFVTIIDLPALLLLGLWFAAQIWGGTRDLIPGEASGVAWWAHIGGFVVGLLLMPLLGAVIGAAHQQQADADDITRRLDAFE
jgi:membrane associated rhomboid family serine protease